MPSWEILLLGAVAGLTIFVGLPLGRLRAPAPRTRALLNATAIGVLVFLLIDVVSKATDPLHESIIRATHHQGPWTHVALLSVTIVVGLTVGLMALVYYDRWSHHPPPVRRYGPGAATAAELRVAPVRGRLAGLSATRRLSLLIALGIGLHNLSEGLAIGQSAASGQLRLALVLIIGFGLHNGTEGFGIVGPLAAEAELPSWRFLATVGLIGGGPTFLGTAIGQAFVNDTMLVGFLALAAGSILYVIIELLNVARRLGHREIATWGILLGLVLGLATDLVLTAAGA